MPNWCLNTVEFEGTPEQIEKNTQGGKDRPTISCSGSNA